MKQPASSKSSASKAKLKPNEDWARLMPNSMNANKWCVAVAVLA